MAWFFKSAASWLRRTWIWDKLKQFVGRLKNPVAFGQKQITRPETDAPSVVQDHVEPPTTEPEPVPTDPQTQGGQQSNAQNEAQDDLLVAQISTAIEEAIPRPSAKIDPSLSVNIDLSEPQLDLKVRERYQSRVGELDTIYSRVASNSENSPKPPKPKADTEAPIDGYDNLIAEYVFSTLSVALPQPDSSESGTKISFQPPYTNTGEDSVVQINNDSGVISSSAKTINSPPVEAVAPDEEEIQVNYRNWNRELYSHLGLNKSSIRLVAIQPDSPNDDVSVTMNVYPLQEIAMRYEALSYVWGSPEPAKKIFVNEVEVSVNPNLYDALVSLRQPNAIRRIWIDAICLNQMSAAEKSKEVPKMGQIYSLAKRVNIVLGTPSSSNSTFIESFLTFLNRKNERKADSKYTESVTELETTCEDLKLDAHDVCKGFVETCLQPWWSRIWTLQEFYLAKEEPTWYWGREQTSNLSLKRDFALLMNSSWELFNGNDTNKLDLSKLTSKSTGLFRNDIERISTLIFRRHTTHGFDNPRRLYRELTARATNPRDFIYGLRAIFNPVFGRVFVPDYDMRTELLFATLVIFLIQFESWGDVLWWYPSRYEPGKSTYPSWLPDFTRHVQLHELDVRPFEDEIHGQPKTKLVVLNHRLYAEGYVVDQIYAHRHIDKSDRQAIIEELWQHDHSLNNNHECHEFFINGAAADDPWLQVFLDMYGAFYSKWTHFNSAFRGALIQTTIRHEDKDKLPTQVAECVPSWDILRWHALRIMTPGLVEALGEDAENALPGFLEGIFSARMDTVFRKAFADFFIGACVFDQAHSTIFLRGLTTAPSWSPNNETYWSAMQQTSPDDVDKRKKAIEDAYNTYSAFIWEEVMQVSWCYSFYYTFLAYIILLDCDNPGSLANVTLKLLDAAGKLRAIYSSVTPEQIDDLASKVPSIATKVSHYNTIIDLFRGRMLVWTQGGFRGITCPGVETCCDNKSVVAIVDGLSFPLIVRDYDEKTGEGWLAGCAVFRGIDMLGRDTEKAGLPPDYRKGEKRVFRFR